MTAPISDERLEEMLAGLEGVTPGPRHTYISPTEILVTDDAGNNIAHFLPMDEDSNADFVNAMAFCRCDPETTRALITELRERRAQSLPSAVTDEMVEEIWAGTFVSHPRTTGDTWVPLKRAKAAIRAALSLPIAQPAGVGDTQKMHRRAQAAEGALRAAHEAVNCWMKVLSGPDGKPVPPPNWLAFKMTEEVQKKLHRVVIEDEAK